jgi:hypothetical protein
MQTNTIKSAQFQVRILDTFRAGDDGHDADGFRDLGEPSSWKDAKATLWTIVQNNRSCFNKGQSWVKGVFIFDAAGKEIVGETTEDLGSLEYSEIVKP